MLVGCFRSDRQGSLPPLGFMEPPTEGTEEKRNGRTVFDGVELNMFDRQLTAGCITGFLNSMDNWPRKDLKYGFAVLLETFAFDRGNIFCQQLLCAFNSREGSFIQHIAIFKLLRVSNTSH